MKKQVKLTLGVLALAITSSILLYAYSNNDTEANSSKEAQSFEVNHHSDFSYLAENKCGEGKCGEGKSSTEKKSEKKCGEGKCGEGKCGEGKASKSKKGEKKEKKCGEGKCGE